MTPSHPYPHASPPPLVVSWVNAFGISFEAPVNCRAVCQNTPACRDGFTSYCKWWQREAVCFGLYWTESGETCFQPRESSCPEGLSVRCADSAGGQGPGPAASEDPIASATGPVVSDVALDGKYCGTIAMMLPLTLQLAGSSFDVSSPHLQSVSGVPQLSPSTRGSLAPSTGMRKNPLWYGHTEDGDSSKGDRDE
ncbi:hypothetical protein FOZ63_031751, partial [Perkinsus olseni]